EQPFPDTHENLLCCVGQRRAINPCEVAFVIWAADLLAFGSIVQELVEGCEVVHTWRKFFLGLRDRRTPSSGFWPSMAKTSSTRPEAQPHRDVSRADDVAAVVEVCIAAFGRVDVLHNNVGIVEVGGPVETTEESWDRVNDVNLKSMFLTCKHVLPHMERQGKGAIVNIASVSGIRWLGVPHISYAANKAAVIQFTRVIALQYARKGIRANSILPGMMDTPMVHAPG